ncbi:hypothetical protein J6590_105853, partial [Homalodisca vitripennis]
MQDARFSRFAARTQGRQLKRRSDRSSMDRETPTSVTLPGQYLPQPVLTHGPTSVTLPGQYQPQPVLTVQDYCLRGRDQQVLQSGSVARADIRDSWSVSAAACANCTGLLSQDGTNKSYNPVSVARADIRDSPGDGLKSGSVARADIRDSPWSVSAAACANCTGLLSQHGPTSVTLPGQYQPQPVLTVQDYCLRGRDQQVLQSGSVARADVRNSPWSVSAAACANCTGLLSQGTGPTSPTIGFGTRADIRDSPWSVSAAACANCTGLLSRGRDHGPTSVTLPGQYQPQPVLTDRTIVSEDGLKSGSVARADIRDSPGLLSQRTGPTSPQSGSVARADIRDSLVRTGPTILQSGSVARADIRDSPWSVSAAACANCTGLLSQ